ncbi:hypothetical protein SELMODRAFT_408702 [Selaginella moellendorffii]|uniref:Uncharacterized protein n=1 Tax=Selaginella moellendorffii TaxID=88036 RepID=D8R9P2_SELML|nr:hypothetical protein SELMODRAFT_408702 [Selaginella moellendorffii]
MGREEHHCKKSMDAGPSSGMRTRRKWEEWGRSPRIGCDVFKFQCPGLSWPLRTILLSKGSSYRGENWLVRMCSALHTTTFQNLLFAEDSEVHMPRLKRAKRCIHHQQLIRLRRSHKSLVLSWNRESAAYVTQYPLKQGYGFPHVNSLLACTHHVVSSYCLWSHWQTGMNTMKGIVDPKDHFSCKEILGGNSTRVCLRQARLLGLETWCEGISCGIKYIDVAALGTLLDKITTAVLALAISANRHQLASVAAMDMYKSTPDSTGVVNSCF